MSLGAILGGVGGLLGGLGEMGAANSATSAQNALTGRQSKLFDTILGMVKQHQQQGGYNADKQVNQYGADLTRQEGLDTGNAAGAARVLGYNPGDSEPQRQQEAIGAKYAGAFATGANQIRNNMWEQQLGDYNNINSAVLNPGIQAYGQQAASANSALSGIGGFFNSIQPYLNPKRAQTQGYQVPGQGGGYAGTGTNWGGSSTGDMYG